MRPLAAAALALAAIPAAAQPVGDFVMSGLNADGTAYSGTVSVRPTGQTYDVRWFFDDEGFQGVGLWNGSTFSVAFYGAFQGIAAYFEITPGVWQGQWAGAGDAAVGQETWRR